MKILYVATKAPWPVTDGGRMLMALTLRALTDAGHQTSLVAPGDARAQAATPAWCRASLVAAAPRSLLRAVVTRMLSGVPVSVARHTIPEVRRHVERALVSESFDVVHAEQLQALAQCSMPRNGAATPPVVLRSQNVESDLVRAAADDWGALRPLVRHEASRMAAFEGAAVARVAATIALTTRDAERLRSLARGAGAVAVVAAPFPEALPAAPPLAGAPAVVLMGSAGWAPNQDAAHWFVAQVWPVVRSRLPHAVLHVFGSAPPVSGAVVTEHAHPLDSQDAFPDGAILAVPLRVASGVRMKILEAWARGVPVVATTAALAGLVAEAGREMLVADDATGFAECIRRIAGEPDLAAGLKQAGRAALGRHHDPRAVAAGLADVYESVLRRAR